MNLERARSFALSLPDATEQPHFEKSSFRVRGKIFATIPPGGQHIHIFVDEYAARALADDEPFTFQVLRWGPRVMGIRVQLDEVDPDRLLGLLEDAWRMRAPKRAIEAWEKRRGGDK